MPDADYYAPGQWNAICDRCGRKFKSSRLRPTWDGLMVCERDWEPRHPQDFVRAPPPEQAPPWTRPESSPNLVLVYTLYLDGSWILNSAQTLDATRNLSNY